MAVRVRFPLRVLQKSSLLADSFFVLVRGNQSVGGGVAELSASYAIGAVATQLR